MIAVSPTARIIARYLTGTMVTYGFMSRADAETIMADLVIIIGGGLAALVEYLYQKAKKTGGPT